MKGTQNAERRMQNEQKWSVVGGQWSVVGIHPSSFILHPSRKPGNELPGPHGPPSTAHRPLVSRRGISLMEVLVSIFILSIGLLGMAALLPLGQMSLLESTKSDRSGACGRAALRDIQVRRMLDYRYWFWQDGVWSPNPSPPPAVISEDQNAVNTFVESSPFVIDPLGRAKNLPFIFGNVLLRRTFSPTPLPPTSPHATRPTIDGQAYFWSDDLPFDAPKNSTARPTLVTSGGSVVSEGNYSWFFTVEPAATEISLPISQRRLFNVSVVVCYKRNFDPNSLNSAEGEHVATINDNNTIPAGFPGMGIGGGTVILANSSLSNNPKVNVKENQWVMLYHADPTTPELNRCNWYRVVGVGMDVPSPNGPTLSLSGPDWDPNLSATLVVVPGAIGVYTTTMELDWDSLWMK
jgi:hypothetical protein